MVNSTNIFWYLLDKMSRNMRRAQDLRDFKEYCLEQKNKEKAEQQRANKKKSILSQLNNILAELSNTQHRIESSNDAIIKECMDEIQKQMIKSMIDFLSTGSAIPSSIPVDPSFSNHLSRVNPELKRLSEQISILQELIRKIKEDIPELSEREQQIVQILLCKSFLESRGIPRVLNMIELCRMMYKSLELLETYSDEIFCEMEKEIEKRGLESKEFDIDQDGMRNNKQSLDKILPVISGLNDKFVKISSSFSEKYSIDTLLSGSEELLLLVESIKNIQKDIEEKTDELDQIRQSVIKFVELELSFRFDFVQEVERDDYESASAAFNDPDDFYRFYEEPAGNLRLELKKSLEIMKQRLV